MPSPRPARLDPVGAQRFLQQVREEMERLAGEGHQPVLLCPARPRLALRRFTELSLPSLVVLAFSKVSPNAEVVTREMIDGAEAA